MEQLEPRRLLSASPVPEPVDAARTDSDRILVQLVDGASPETLAASMAISTASWQENTEAYATPGLFSMQLASSTDMQATLEAYRSSPLVAFAEPDYPIRLTEDSQLIPIDPQFGSLYGLHNTGQTGGTIDADIDAPEAWNITTGSPSTIIAVIDSGVDYTHEDLIGNLWLNGAEVPGNNIDDDGNGYIDDYHGFDFYDNDGDPMDENGHGTHVAGTIGAVGGNDVGVTGVNHQVQIMPIRFLGPDGSGYTSDAISALEYAVANGALISNNSWGGGGFSQAMFSALEYARDAGHIFVAAAGNSSRDHDTEASFPASYEIDNVVSVAATDHHDQLAYFSDFGATTVDVAAPGTGILSTTPGNTYSSYSGTSMAAPHAAGVLGLMRSAHPEWTARQLIHQLTVSSDPVAGLEDLTISGGRINAAASLDPSFQSRASLNFDQSTYEAGTTVTVRLIDFDYLDSAFYTNIHSSSGDTEWLEFNRIEPGVLEASIATGIGEADETNGILDVSPGDVISITFHDQDDGTGLPRELHATARIQSDDHGNEAATATPIDIGTSTTGEIEQGGDTDWFSFFVSAGQDYEFTTDLLTLSDTTLSLYDQDGETLLEFDDDGGPGLASRINWTASTSSTVYLKVAAYSSSQTGTYSLNVHAFDTTPDPADDHGDDAASATPVLMNSTTEGTIEASFDSDWFQFTAVAGEDYIFETHLGSLPDSWLELYDQDGQTLLTLDDDGGEGPASRIEWTAIGTGTYFLNVEGYDVVDDIGSYTLDVAAVDSSPVPTDDHGDNATTATPVMMNSSTDGVIEDPLDSDWFQFAAVAGENYVFETHLETLPDSWLELYDQDGQTLLTLDNDGGDGTASRIEWTATGTGTYFLNVEGFDLVTHTGSYTLDVHLVDSNPAPTDLIDIAVGFTDMQGQPIESLLAGQTFQIQITASDLRDSADWQGVLAAFADVVYDAHLIDVSAIQYHFDDFTFGSLTDGEVDDAGGLELDGPSSPGAQPVFTLTATASQPGNLEVSTNAAENLLAENLLFGTDGDLRERTRYGSGNISILGELSLELSTNEFAENAGPGAATATVSRSELADLSQSLVVMLSSSDPTEATVPQSVTIPAGQTSITFDIDAVDDHDIDGTQIVVITATAANYVTETATVNVTDFELADLVVTQFDILDDHLLGGVASVQLEIANHGTGMAAPFEASVVLSEDDIIGNEDDVVVGTLEFTEGLAPGEVSSHEFDTTDLRSLLYEQALTHDAPGLGIGYLSENIVRLGLHLDPAGDVSDSSTFNNTAADDVTYFPWDTDGNGTVTPADVGYIVNRIGSADSIADMDGSGHVTATEVVAALNRIGYVRNESVMDLIQSSGDHGQSGLLSLTGLDTEPLIATSSDTATLPGKDAASIQSDEAMGIGVSLTDLSGTPIRNLRVGQSFQIRMIAEDLRDDQERTSVISAYADVLFDPESLEISEIDHAFAVHRSGEIDSTAGIVSGLGGLQVNITSPSPGPQLVAVLTAEATSIGPITIQTEVPDDTELQNTLYLTDSDVREMTRYGAATAFVLPEIADYFDGDLTLTMPNASTDELSVDVDEQGAVTIQTASALLPTGIAASDVASLVISGTTGDDVIDLGSVTRAAFTSLSLISVEGHSGHDRITMPRNEFIPALLSGDDGNDTLEGGASDDTLNGGDGNDLITGNRGNDSLTGLAGSDTLIGRTGNDVLQGGEGDDVLLGNAGHDTLNGDAGDDVIRGHSGRDVLIGGHGDDRLVAGPGHDWLLTDSENEFVRTGGGQDTVSGGSQPAVSSTETNQLTSRPSLRQAIESDSLASIQGSTTLGIDDAGTTRRNRLLGNPSTLASPSIIAGSRRLDDVLDNPARSTQQTGNFSNRMEASGNQKQTGDSSSIESPSLEVTALDESYRLLASWIDTL